MSTSSNNDAQETAATRRCVSCCESIAIESKKCRFCGTNQNWVRYIFFSNSLIAVLIACISLISIAWPSILRMTSFDNSKIHPSFYTIRDNSIFIIAQNDGISAGGIDAVEIVDESDQWDGSLAELEITQSASDTVVSPGGVKVIGGPILLSDKTEDVEKKLEALFKRGYFGESHLNVVIQPFHGNFYRKRIYISNHFLIIALKSQMALCQAQGAPNGSETCRILARIAHRPWAATLAN